MNKYFFIGGEAHGKIIETNGSMVYQIPKYGDIESSRLVYPPQNINIEVDCYRRNEMAFLFGRRTTTYNPVLQP